MKKIKLLTIILAIVLVSIIGFVGIFVQAPNKIENIVKDYTFASNLYGKREVVMNPVKENTENEDKKDYTENDYETAKKTIENRLKFYKANDYSVALNKETGTIKVDIEENENTDYFIYKMNQSADFEISKEDGTVLIDETAIKTVEANYDYINNGYQAYIDVKLNKEFNNKLSEITEKYAYLVDEVKQIEETKSSDESTSENTEITENTLEEKYSREMVTLKINDKEYYIFEIKNNVIKILIGDSTKADSSVIESNMETAYDLKGLLESGLYQVEYDGTQRFVASSITIEKIKLSAIIFGSIVLIALIIYIVLFKINGLLAALSYIGQAAIMLLLIRYTNVALSIEGLFGIILISIINYLLIFRILKNIKNKESIKESTAKAYKKTIKQNIPVFILVIVACFTEWLSFVSFGLVMFWGIVVSAVFNITITKLMLKINAGK